MNRMYKFFGGRKLTIFFTIFTVNCLILLLTNKWSSEFGWFCVGAYATIVAGIEYEKRGKNAKTNIEE